MQYPDPKFPIENTVNVSPYPPANQPPVARTTNQQVEALANAATAAKPQQFIPEQMIVDANGRLAQAMGNMTAQSAEAMRQQELYKQSGDTIEMMYDKTPAKHWTGVVAKGLQGWAMRKERKRGAEAAAAQATSAAAAKQYAQEAKMAQEDKAFARDLQKAEWQEKMKQQYATEKQTEWMYKRDGFARQQQIKRMQKEGLEVDPMLLQQDAAFSAWLEHQTKNSALMGGINTPTSSNMNKLQESVYNTDKIVEVMTNTYKAGIDDALFGALGDLKDQAGGFMNYFGDFIPDDMTSDELRDHNYRKSQLTASIYGVGANILHELSGAAVTANEWERFKKFFPMGNFQSKEDFHAKFNVYLRDRTIEKLLNMRTMGINPETGLYDPQFKPLISDEEYQARVKNVNAFYQAQIEAHAPIPRKTRRAQSEIPLTADVAQGDTLSQRDDAITADLKAALAGAEKAIQRGADPEKVKQRLREAGYDPSGIK